MKTIVPLTNLNMVSFVMIKHSLFPSPKVQSIASRGLELGV